MLLAQQDTRPLINFTVEPLFQDHGIPLAVMGILVVFMALVLVVISISLLPRILAPFTRSQESKSTALQPVSDDELPEETLVVIAAAVAAVLDRPHRIVHIRGMTPADHGWSLEGRLQQHQSHRIPHRDHR